MRSERKGKWSRRTRQQWCALMAKYEGSGGGVEQFCRREGVSGASFYRWRALLAHSYRRVGQANDGGAPAQFIDLGSVDSAPTKARIEFKLDLGEGIVVYLVRH